MRAQQRIGSRSQPILKWRGFLIGGSHNEGGKEVLVGGRRARDFGLSAFIRIYKWVVQFGEEEEGSQNPKKRLEKPSSWESDRGIIWKEKIGPPEPQQVGKGGYQLPDAGRGTL